MVLYDEVGNVLADPGIAPPIRFLPEFDNILLAHARRTRIITEADRAMVFTVNGIIRPTVLVDGFVGALWKAVGSGDSALVTVQPLRALSAQQVDAIRSEGHAAGRFLHPAARHVSVVVEHRLR
jgi:hypothetical protein